MAGEVVGAIHTDRKPRTRKSAAEQLAQLDKALSKARARMNRAEKAWDTLCERRRKMVADMREALAGAEQEKT